MLNILRLIAVKQFSIDLIKLFEKVFFFYVFTVQVIFRILYLVCEIISYTTF